MSERSDPGGRPGYGSGRICNNYADFHSRKAGSVPDPDRKVLDWYTNPDSSKWRFRPNPDSVPVPNSHNGNYLYTIHSHFQQYRCMKLI